MLFSADKYKMTSLWMEPGCCDGHMELFKPSLDLRLETWQQNQGAHFHGQIMGWFPGNHFPVSCSPFPVPSSWPAVRGTFQQLALAPCHSSFVYRDHLQRLFIAAVQIPAFLWHDE